MTSDLKFMFVFELGGPKLASISKLVSVTWANDYIGPDQLDYRKLRGLY